MKRFYCIILVALFAVTLPALSQESSFKIGIGASFNFSEAFPAPDSPENFQGANPLLISVPMIISPLLLEPRVGYVSRSHKTTTKTGSTNVEVTETGSLLSADIGAFYLIPLSQASSAYLGLRVGYAMWSTKTKSSTTVSQDQSGFLIGPAAGGEYFLSDYFSLGAEAGLVFYSLGDVNNDPAPAIDTQDVSTTIIQTNASIIARFYFNK